MLKEYRQFKYTGVHDEEAQVGLSDFADFSEWIAVLKDLRSVISETLLCR